MRNIVIYGGTFDPPHYGHLKTAYMVQYEYEFEKFIFLPCKVPVIKEASNISISSRVDMLKLAILPYLYFDIDLREINRDTPSYMVTTLESFREELGKAVSISILMGQDAFVKLPQWYQWERLLTLCNILVIKRPHYQHIELSKELGQMLKDHKTEKSLDLLTTSHGKIIQYNAGQYDLSSTWIREQLRKGCDVSKYIPPTVYNYIQEKKLYFD